MKKDFINLFALLTILFVFASCHKDNNTGGNEVKQTETIVLSLDRNELTFGDNLKYEVKNSAGKLITESISFKVTGKGSLASLSTSDMLEVDFSNSLLTPTVTGTMDIVAVVNGVKSEPVSITCSHTRLDAESMNTVNGVFHIKEQQFKDYVWDTQKFSDKIVYKGDLPLILKFGATWCGPCRMLVPVLEEIAQEYKDRAYVVDIDIETTWGRELFANTIDIRKDNKGSIPYSVMIAPSNKKIESIVGVRGGLEGMKAEFSRFINENQPAQ